MLLVTQAEIEAKLIKVKAARYLYTYEGVMQEIDYFIKESDTHNHTSRASHLRCTEYQYDENIKLAAMLDTNLHATVLRH